MHKISTWLIMLVAIAWLAACATATPYQPARKHGDFGYSSQQLENNRFRVTFAGNANTDRDTVRNYLLYRAAKLTLEHGDDYFIVTDQNTQNDVDYATTNVGMGWPFGWGFGLGGVASTTASNRYTAHGIITIHKGSKPADNPRAYNAKQIVEHLGPTIKYPQ